MDHYDPVLLRPSHWCPLKLAGVGVIACACGVDVNEGLFGGFGLGPPGGTSTSPDGWTTGSGSDTTWDDGTSEDTASTTTGGGLGTTEDGSGDSTTWGTAEETGSTSDTSASGESTGTSDTSDSGEPGSCGTVLSTDFASCPDGWTVEGNAGWECGTTYSGPSHSANLWGTVLAGTWYNPNTEGSLVSPLLDLSACPDEPVELRIKHWYNFFDSMSTGVSDGGVVEVTTDASTWEVVAPTGGYDGYVGPLGMDGFMAEHDASWKNSVFDLSAYAGSPAVQVRFRFAADGSWESWGWYIDAVDIDN